MPLSRTTNEDSSTTRFTPVWDAAVIRSAMTVPTALALTNTAVTPASAEVIVSSWPGSNRASSAAAGSPAAAGSRVSARTGASSSSRAATR
jgi:hypothetical protein